MTTKCEDCFAGERSERERPMCQGCPVSHVLDKNVVGDMVRPLVKAMGELREREEELLQASTINRDIAPLAGQARRLVEQAQLIVEDALTLIDAPNQTQAKQAVSDGAEKMEGLQREMSRLLAQSGIQPGDL